MAGNTRPCIVNASADMGDLHSIDGGKKPAPPKCPFCGLTQASRHPGNSCPRIARMEFYEDGTIQVVEYVSLDDWAEFLRTLKKGS